MTDPVRSGPSHRVHYGDRPVPELPGAPTGSLVSLDGDDFYVIENPPQPPFLMSLASDSDHWLFVASNGPLSAGRRSPSFALFPYVTEDKIYDSEGTTGPTTSLRVSRGGREVLWHPFRASDTLTYVVTRRIYKSLLGHRVLFEETHPELGLTFRYGWRTSERYGFVRECMLRNDANEPVEVHLLDGLLNLLPADVDDRLQSAMSSLVDAYKKNERIPGTTLALFTLAAQVVDRPEARESLHATCAFGQGLDGARVLLTADAVERFERGQALDDALEVRGRRGAYLLEARLPLAAGAVQRWRMAADVGRSQRDVVALLERLARPIELAADLDADLAHGAEGLRRIVASTDGLQGTADAGVSAHHLANVLFNDMRGGIYADGYRLPAADFAAFVKTFNRPLWQRRQACLEALPSTVERAELVARCAREESDLERLALEYLPLTFSRRHGDPSRPWNRFDIRVRDPKGGRRLGFEGNWRDIFQNWEALSLSHPEFVEHMVAKFVNATTADGYNAYRISKSGIDWEVPEPDAVWSALGYWGDHQIVYLHRLLELSLRHHPARLPAMLERPLFVFADVPYEIRPYADIVRNPRATVRFDAAKHERILQREKALGADARLLHRGEELVHVTLLEKLFVTTLAKLANFVPGGGIWMNTQRPEWNDANNALVGYGISMVTLCQLERFLELLRGMLRPLAGKSTPLSKEVAEWAARTLAALKRHEPMLASRELDDGERGDLMEALGTAASDYRQRLYREGLSGASPAQVDDLLELATRAAAFARHTIGLNRRSDGLFHSYNLLVPRGPGNGFGVSGIYPMLEGQVAVLGSGALDARGACEVLDALAASPLYREDQRSYLLYPDRRLPSFLEKNLIPPEALRGCGALQRMLTEGDERVIVRDAAGQLRFHESLCSDERCREALVEAGLEAPEVERAMEVYEGVFHHRAFTGRSGSMFAYEGLGSIYWHMVGKLLLAVEERFFEALDGGADRAILDRLERHYQTIQDGMGGLRKTPAEWGAFPLDPYSHSPRHRGASQPGMTGQVKESILIRFGELGVRVRDGRLRFQPRLLARSEFFDRPASFEAIDVNGKAFRIQLEPGSLAFTYCQVPVVFHLGEEPSLRWTDRDGQVHVVSGDQLDLETSAAVFGRTGRVRRIDACVTPGRR